MTEPQAITEEMKVHEQWYVDAKEQTLESLPAFMAHLTGDYRHDYGTICHAVAACAIGAVWAANRSPQGGITGFQAGAIMWEFVQNWLGEKGPMTFIRFEEMLYPQYAHKFGQRLDSHTWGWLQAEAAKHFSEGAMHPDVRDHCQSIVNGKVPFGWVVADD